MIPSSAARPTLVIHPSRRTRVDLMAQPAPMATGATSILGTSPYGASAYIDIDEDPKMPAERWMIVQDQALPLYRFWRDAGVAPYAAALLAKLGQSTPPERKSPNPGPRIFPLLPAF